MSFQIDLHDGNFLLPPLRSLHFHRFFFSNCMRLLYFILDLIKPESVKNLTVDRIEYDPKEEYHPLAQIKVTISLITEKGAYFKRVYSYHPNGR